VHTDPKTDPAAKRGRKPRDRTRTESDLLDAARRLFDRDGVLAGLNLNEVATEAGVNRGQIYQIYGSRRALLRAALVRGLERLRSDRPRHWDADFGDRRRAMMRLAIPGDDVVFPALLALDGDDDYHVFPAIEQTRSALERDKATGALPPGADGEALHALTAATAAGYALFRKAMARDLGVPVEELDERVLTVYDRIIDDITDRDKPERTR
jgi:AcrR family transcriptional regulator